MRSLIVIGVLLHISHGMADVDCSESPGSCVSRRSSLMQVRSLQRKTDEATTMRAKLAGFQQFTEKMIAKFGQEPAGDGVDDNSQGFKDAQDAVRLVLLFIDRMYEELKKYHEQQLVKVAECSTIYRDCIALHATPSTRKTMVKDRKAYRNKKGLHETCREDRKQLVDDENLACTKYDNYRWENNSALLPTCVGTDALGKKDENAFAAIYMKAKPWTAFVDDVFEPCLEDTNTWINPLWELFQGCQRNGPPACVVKGEQCRKLQHDFEEAHCEWHNEKDVICSNIYDCVEGKVDGCRTRCDGVEQDAAARAADNETGMRLECLLAVLFGERDPDSESGFKPRLSPQERQNALDTCKNRVYNTSYWEIKCPVDWTPEHPEFGDLEWKCNCAPVADKPFFLKRHYYNDPPALGTICPAAQEKDPDTGVDCCRNQNISTPYVCERTPQEHCMDFALDDNVS